jgi:hypothetical protein
LLKILRLQLSGGSQVCDDNWATRGGIDQAPNFTSGVETMHATLQRAASTICLSEVYDATRAT